MATTKHARPKNPPARVRRADLASQIEREIVRGNWMPGSRLPGEADFCIKYGASRPMVREALKALKARGLVESRRGSGSYLAAEPGMRGVRDMMSLYSALVQDAPAFLELLDLRLLVETFCIRKLSETSGAGRLTPLRECLARMEASAHDLKRFGRADIDFHLALVKLAGHRLFFSVMSGLMPDLGVRFAIETYTDHSLVKRNLADHRAILRLAATGDADGAEERLRNHLIRSRRHLESLLKIPPQSRDAPSLRHSV